MKNLKAYIKINSTTRPIKLGTLTILSAQHRMSISSIIDFQGKIFLAANDYDEDALYSKIHIQVSSKGIVERIYEEEEGVLPSYFKFSEEELWVRLVPLHLTREYEINLPIEQRDLLDLPKRRKSSLGNFIGNIDNQAVLHQTDIWKGKKQDNLYFYKKKLRKDKISIDRKKLSIDFPNRNKICIEEPHFHLIGRSNDKYIHREIDRNGRVNNLRELDLGKVYIKEALKLSFESESLLIYSIENELFLVSITPDGAIEHKLLYKFSSMLFNTWKPVEIVNDKYVIRFNKEDGNGWMILQNEELTDIFFTSNQLGKYINLKTDEIIDICDDDLVINGLVKTGLNKYAVVFRPREDVKQDSIYILNVY